MIRLLAFAAATRRLVRPPRSADDGPRASQGQILIMFALMSGALFGILGLAIDVGYAVSQRRSMQNAADLAAIAGAHAVAEYHQDTNEIDAYGAVSNVVIGNKTSEGAPKFKCSYIKDDLSNLTTGCKGDVPEKATGVRVRVEETHPTFFIRVLPGAPKKVTTKAVAAARVELQFRAGMDSPFIVCGYGAKLAGGGEMDILIDDTHVNPKAVGETFRIVGDNIARPPADTDGDGLSDIKEAKLGTASGGQDDDDDGVPDGGDTDHDGVPDGLEVANGTKPLVKDVPDLDADDDGLTDAEELALPKPTDPNDWDSDDDDLSDWAEEIVYHTDSLKDDPADHPLRDADKDGDGLTDTAEGGPNKNQRDSDDGGTPDGLEAARGTVPDDGYERDDDWDFDGDGLRDNVDPDPHVWDADGGGISDWAEAIPNGTDPLDGGVDDKGTGADAGVDEISNCGMTLVDKDGDVSEVRRDYKKYNREVNRAWNGFALNNVESPNNDNRGTTPPSATKPDKQPGDNRWTGRRGNRPPAHQRYTVDGVNGCYGSNIIGNPDGHTVDDASTFGPSLDGNCILSIAVATTTTSPTCPVTPASSFNQCTFTVVKVLSFKVARKAGTLYYEAQLLDDYPTFGGSNPGWTRDSGGTVVIKLKE